MKTRYKYLTALVIIVILIASLLYYQNQNTPHRHNTLYLGGIFTKDEPINLLFRSKDSYNFFSEGFIFSSLITVNENAEPTGDLAMSWVKSPENTSITFKLKANIFFKNASIILHFLYVLLFVYRPNYSLLQLLGADLLSSEPTMAVTLRRSPQIAHSSTPSLHQYGRARP